MKVMENGGSINADFQCSVARTTAHIGHDHVLVMNTCKDFIPSDYWVCICLHGLRFVHVDVRELGITLTARKPKDLRVQVAHHFIFSKTFADANALWQYAREHDLPRIFVEEACARFPDIPIDDADRATNAAARDAAQDASCRALG